MTNETTLPGQEKTGSFLGLQSYTESQSDKFFGRDVEIDTLANLVQSNALTIVFGRSGTGKTSLLNAGVFPKLRKKYCLPFRIRLEFGDIGDKVPDLVTQTKNVLKEEIDKYGFKVQSYPAADETLWEYFHQEILWKTVTPILVFDQFEEIFTLAKSNPRYSTELPAFWQELSDLIENNIPKKLQAQFVNEPEKITYSVRDQKSKTVFAFREEYLPEFESITAKIPSIKLSRFRLMPMNGHQAYEVITKTWKDHIDAREATQIVSYLTNETNEENFDLVTVEPSLLSQVCAYIDKERINQGFKSVTAELLTKYPKETILRSIYEEAVAASGAAVTPSEEQDIKKNKALPNPVKIFLEEKMIDSAGNRTKYSLTAKEEEGLRPGIEILKEKYFIREDEKSVELTHDVLAPIIKTDRERRRRLLAAEAEKKKVIKRGLMILGILALLALIPLYLAYQEKVRLNIESASLTDSINIKNDNIQSKADSIKTLDSLITLKNNTKKGKPNFTTPENSGKGDSSLQKIVDRLRRDSIKYVNIINPSKPIDKIDAEELNRLISLLGAQKAENERQLVEISALKAIISSLNRDIAGLKSLEAACNEKYKSLQNLYKTTNDLLEECRKKLPDLSKSMQLDLYFNSNVNGLPKPPENTVVYLIPKNDKNRRTIRNARVYEIGCEESVKKADGVKRAFFYNDRFVFPDVKPGDYFVKICSYYGGYYNVKKTKLGIESLPLNISPPIR